MVRSLVFAFPVVPRNYTWFDAANNRGLAPRTASHFALRAFREVANPSTASGTRGLRVLTIPGRSYRIRLHVSACYPYFEKSADLVERVCKHIVKDCQKR